MIIGMLFSVLKNMRQWEETTSNSKLTQLELWTYHMKIFKMNLIRIILLLRQKTYMFYRKNRRWTRVLKVWRFSWITWLWRNRKCCQIGTWSTISSPKALQTRPLQEKSTQNVHCQNNVIVLHESTAQTGEQCNRKMQKSWQIQKKNRKRLLEKDLSPFWPNWTTI